MMSFVEKLEKIHGSCCRNVPSRMEAIEWLRDFVALLFPGTHGPQISSRKEIESRLQGLEERFCAIIRPAIGDEGERGKIAKRLFSQVPEIYESLLEDAELFCECDPAATGHDEVILCYPGFYAIVVYRLAHAIHRLGVPVLPRLLAEYAHSRTGIDIHPAAKIGRHLFIDHGTGIVIGETCVIGDGVKIYQGVTLGATFVKKELQGTKRHPTIEDGVILYAGCTILGGETVIGRGSTIGGNVWLTSSVAPGTRIFYRAEIE